MDLQIERQVIPSGTEEAFLLTKIPRGLVEYSRTKERYRADGPESRARGGESKKHEPQTTAAGGSAEASR